MSHIIDSIIFLAPQVGLEPTTLRLTAECSAIELLRSVTLRSSFINLAERFKSVKNCFSRRNPCPSYAYPLLFANNCRQFPIGGNCRLRRSWDAFRPGMKGGTFISNLSRFGRTQIIDAFRLLKLRAPWCLPDFPSSAPVYPSCAENPAVQGGDVERGERSSPKLNSVSAAARCTGG